MNQLNQDFTLAEVATALGMSARWVRDRCNLDGAEHQRYGHKIRFTAEQVEKLRTAHLKSPASGAITSGRRSK